MSTRTLVETARTSGLGTANQTYEDGIRGLSAPIFDHTGHFAGAVAVACVASRYTSDLEQLIKSELIRAAREITQNWGGTTPPVIEAAWAGSVASSNALETVS